MLRRGVPFRWSNQSGWMPCVLLALLGGVLRAVHVDQPSLTFAEAPSLQFAYAGLHTLIQSMLTQYQVPPLYYMAVRLMATLFPPVLAARLPALVPGVGLIVLTYVFARLLVGNVAATVAAAIVALSPLAVWYSHVGGGYELGACLALLSSVLLLMAPRRGGWWPAAYAISLSLALYAAFAAALVIFAQGVLLLWLVLSRRRASTHTARPAWIAEAFAGETGSRLRDCLGAYGAGWLFALPWFLFLPSPSPLLPRPQQGGLGVQWVVQAVAQSLGLSAGYAHLPATLPFTASIVLLAGYADAAALIVASAIWVPTRRASLAPLCVLTLVPIPIEALLAIAGLPLATPFGAAVILLPGVAIVAGAATELAGSYVARMTARAEPVAAASASVMTAVPLGRGARWRTGLLLLLAVAIFVGGANATWLTVERGGSTGEHWDQIAAELSAKVTADDVVIYDPLNVAPVVEAYLPPDTAWLSQQQGLYPRSDAATQQHFASWIAGRAHVWIVYYSVPGADLPTQGAWLTGQGYCRLQGDPSAPYGLLEYAPCAT